MIGGISVSVTTGLGAAIVTTAMGDNQVSLLRQFQEVILIIVKFKHWFIYFLTAFVVVTLGASKDSENSGKVMLTNQ